MRLTGRVVAVVAAVSLLVTTVGCADPTAPADGEPAPRIQLYGADAVMRDSFGAELADPTVLTGMKGTAPLNRLPAGFTDRLLAVDPSLDDFLYTGETYDAIVISALAAELAGTPDPAVVRTYVNGVTTGGRECRDLADCLESARAGEDLAYRGVSTPAGFTPAGQPSVASYATLHFGEDGTIDEDKIEYVGAGDPADTGGADPPEPDPLPAARYWSAEPLVLGGLLPESGDLSFAHAPLAAAAELAVTEINEAGGVFGTDVRWLPGDSGTDPDVALAGLRAHVDEGAHIVIGPTSSGVTGAVLPAASEAGRIVFTPASTATGLDEPDEQGYLFRTAPPDDLQAAALADVILRDGTERVAVVARADSYGRGLAEELRRELLEFGLRERDVRVFPYRLPEREGGLVPGLEELIGELEAATPEAVVVIGYSEAAQFVRRLADLDLLAQG